MSFQRRQLQKKVKSLWETWLPNDPELVALGNAFANANSMFNKHEKAVTRDVYGMLEPYVTVFEQCILYLFVKSLCTTHRIENDRSLAPIALLIGAACNFAVSIRRLVLSGLDAPARALLRPFLDHLLASIVLVNDDALRHAFAAADDFELAKRFWLKCLTHDKIVAKLSEILRQYGIDKECSKELFDYLQQERQMHSQVIHPGNVGAGASVVDYNASGDPQLVLLGRASFNSERTLCSASFFVHLFSVIAVLAMDDLRGRTGVEPGFRGTDRADKFLSGCHRMVSHLVQMHVLNNEPEAILLPEGG
jgi:hypothetical protein